MVVTYSKIIFLGLWPFEASAIIKLIRISIFDLIEPRPHRWSDYGVRQHIGRQHYGHTKLAKLWLFEDKVALKRCWITLKSFYMITETILIRDQFYIRYYTAQNTYFLIV